jgi:hypothetical protein
VPLKRSVRTGSPPEPPEAAGVAAVAVLGLVVAEPSPPNVR